MASPELVRSAVTRAPASAQDPAAAFEAMVHAHYATLGAFAWRLAGSRAAAEDIVHEVLLRIWRGRQHFGFENPLPYLYQAVRNEADSWRRRAGRAAEIGDHEDPGPDAQRAVEMNDLRGAVAQAVDAMPARRREIFRMQREQGLTYAQIASLLGISIKTVEVQMGRALKAIRLRAAPFLALAIALLK